MFPAIEAAFAVTCASPLDGLSPSLVAWKRLLGGGPLPHCSVGTVIQVPWEPSGARAEWLGSVEAELGFPQHFRSGGSFPDAHG